MPYEQGYIVVFLDENDNFLSFIDPTDFGNSTTLMGHSLFNTKTTNEEENNEFLTTLERCIIPGGPLYKQKILWSGWCADDFFTPLEDRLEKTYYDICNDITFLNQFKCTKDGCKMLDWTSEKNCKILNDVIWNEKNDEKNSSSYKYDSDNIVKYLAPLTKSHAREYNYLVNHSKKEFILKSGHTAADGNLNFHPLGLLTSEGNGLGYGDYYGCNEHLAGSWARDSISLEKVQPSTDFVEMKVKFRQTKGHCNECGKIHQEIVNSDAE